MISWSMEIRDEVRDDRGGGRGWWDVGCKKSDL